MHKISFTIIPFLLASSIGFGQVDTISLKSIYENETIYFNGKKYVKHNTAYPLPNLATEFENSPEGYQQFKMYKSDLKQSNIYLYVGVLTYASGLLVLERNNNLGIGLLAGSFIPLSINLNLNARANKKIRKAIWLRNRDVLLK